MMMPANFSAVAENEMTYVVGGSLVDVLAPAMTTANWQNVSANVIKIVGNAFLNTHGNNVLTTERLSFLPRLRSASTCR